MRRSAAATLAVLALCGCGSSPPGPATSPAVSATARALALRSFSIFRRPAHRGDQIPADQAAHGVAPKLSRLAYSGPLGMLYAYLDNGLLCVSYATRVSPKGAGSASGGCQSAQAASSTGVAAPVAASFDQLNRVALLLPDGVRTVTLTRSPGGTATARVSGNALVYVARGLRSWTFTTAGGARASGSLPIPRPAAPATGPPSAQVSPTVAPVRGGPQTVFVVKLIPHAVLGPHQGVTTRYRATLRFQGPGPLAPGCGGTAAPPSVERGSGGMPLTLALHPGRAGWCRGAYAGRVRLESGPVCRSCASPYPGVEVGRFAFTVG